MRAFALSLLVALPAQAFAAGSESPTPPKPTDTTKFCEDGYVFDDSKNICVKVEDSTHLTPDEKMETIRELAYAGRYGDALVLLSQMDASDDLVLTYQGFVARKLGQIDEANTYYMAAIAQNPDNLLARSYMAQGFVAEGKIELARAELAEITTRGGRETWAAVSLRNALRSGQGYSY